VGDKTYLMERFSLASDDIVAACKRAVQRKGKSAS